MKPLPRWFRAFIRIVSIIPPLGGAIAWRLFWQLGTPAAVRESERAVHDAARVTDFDGVALYEWGDGDRVVLLVHGWRSRASRFSAIITQLVERGYTVVSFDAPANGDSAGTKTHAFEYADVVTELGHRYGRFDAIIAHSLGAVPTFVAARAGTRVDRIVTIAGVHDFDSIVRTFTRTINLGPAADRAFRRKISRWVAPRGINPWKELVSELDPTVTTIPLLVVHDASDPEVLVDQATAIAEAHTGAVESLITEGLGHHRIVSDPATIAKIMTFVTEAIPRATPTK